MTAQEFFQQAALLAEVILPSDEEVENIFDKLHFATGIRHEHPENFASYAIRALAEYKVKAAKALTEELKKQGGFDG